VRWKTQCRNQQHALDYRAIGDEFITKQNAKLLAVYDQQIEALEKAIQDLIEGDTVLKAQVERLTAIKGLALLSVAVLIAETNGFENFVNQRQLVSYAGYDVVENQSGNRSGKTARRPGRISKKGNSRIRRILHMPAFNAVRFGEPTCQALYERVYQRTNTKMNRGAGASLCGCAKEVITLGLCIMASSNNVCSSTCGSGSERKPFD
jgi:transposase